MLEHVVRYQEIRSSAVDTVVTERFDTLVAAQWSWDELSRQSRQECYPRIKLLTARPGSDQYIHSQFSTNRRRNPR